MGLSVTPASVGREREFLHDRADVIVTLLNDTRDTLAARFGTDVAHVSEATYHEEVDAVFRDGEVAVNVAGYVGLLRELDVTDDYPGFVVDEVLGRELAATIAGGQPLSLLAQATFHVADSLTHGDGPAGADDLDAALAAGFQTRLPGWEWRDGKSPFAVE